MSKVSESASGRHTSADICVANEVKLPQEFRAQLKNSIPLWKIMLGGGKGDNSKAKRKTTFSIYEASKIHVFRHNCKSLDIFLQLSRSS